jgi:hypothetical protein
MKLNVLQDDNDVDPVSGVFLTPGSGIRDPDLGWIFSGSRIQRVYFLVMPVHFLISLHSSATKKETVMSKVHEFLHRYWSLPVLPV